MMSLFDGLGEDTPYRDAVVRGHASRVSQSLAHDQTCYLESLLDRQDKMSMAASVEARVPFCNPNLFDFINRIPAEVKLKDNTTKYLLKRIGEQYLERSLLYRRKNGLNLPVEDWLRRGPLSDRLQLLTDQTALERGFYNHRAIADAIDKHRKGERDLGRYLLYILVFEIWMRMFIDKQAKVG
jgi:asparagine synthase (glutamine-hydrolysing)